MLIARLATAVVAVPLLLAIVWIGGPLFVAVVGLAALVAAGEAASLLVPLERRTAVSGEGSSTFAERKSSFLRHSPPSAFPAMLTALALVGAALGGTDLLVAVAALAVMLNSALALGEGRGDAASLRGVGTPLRSGTERTEKGELLSFTPSPPHPFAPASLSEAASPRPWIGQLAAGLYAGFPLAILVLLRFAPGPSVLLGWLGQPMARGVAWVLVTFTSVWAVDTVAYVVGRLVGRRRLWPRVSPKKTWEGTIAGFVAGGVVALAWAGPLGLSVGLGLVLGVVVAASAILGDLLESAMKRAAGVKDAGVLFPGHGGLLDRLDSLSFALVVVFLIKVIAQ